MRTLSLSLVVLVGILAGPALAQTTASGVPTRIRGTVEKLDGQVLTVKSREGQTLPITLTPDASVLGVVKKDLADIKPGDFVGVTSVKDRSGVLKALEVHIFPEAMRGTGEGQRPWDLVPDSSMTNATVSEAVGAPQGRMVKVNYKGGEAEVVVPPGAPVISYVPGDRSLLKPGAAVFVIALKKDDGSLSASRVTAEKDGVKPPM